MNNKCIFTTHLHSWMSCIVRKGFLCHFCGITVYRASVIRPHHTAAKTSASGANSTDGLYILGSRVWCRDGIGKDTLAAPERENHLLISKHIGPLVEKPQSLKCKAEDKQHWMDLVEWHMRRLRIGPGVAKQFLFLLMTNPGWFI